MKTKTDQHATYNTLKFVATVPRQQQKTLRVRTIIHFSIELIAFFAEYTLFNSYNFNLVYRYSLSVNLTLSITV